MRVDAVPQSAVCGSPCMFRQLDLHSVRKDDLVFAADWHTVLSTDVGAPDGFLVWFDIFFATSRAEGVAPPDITVEQWRAGQPRPRRLYDGAGRQRNPLEAGLAAQPAALSWPPRRCPRAPPSLARFPTRSRRTVLEPCACK